MNEQVIHMILEGIRDTLYMTLSSVVIGYVFGLPFGILLYTTGKNGLLPNRLVYRIGDFVCNIVRSIPFLILLILLIPFTRLVVGQSYGSTATIVPLVVCAAPYIARVVESSLNEVDTKGFIAGSEDFPDQRLYDHNRTAARLFRHVRNSRRRRPWRYRGAVWLL